MRDGAVLRDVAQQVAQGLDGALRFDAVPPGRYVVDVMAPGRVGGPGSLEGLVPVTTEGDDVLVTVTVNRGASIAGRVTALPMPPGFDVDPVVAAMLAEARTAGPTRALAFSWQGGRLTTAVASDGTFVLEGVRGRVRLGVESAVGAWLSTRIGTDNVTGTGFSVTGEERVGAEIVVTEGFGLITGRVADAAGKPATGHIVVAFPDDERLRIAAANPWAVTAPTLQSWNTMPKPLTLAGWTRETLEGSFRIPPLPPGTFRIAAFPHDQSRRVAPLDPDVLRALHPLATRVTLAPGQHVVLKLTAVPVPEIEER